MWQHKILSNILVALFGSSTWLIVNAAWMQMPLMVNVLPEQWNLPSYLALIVQLGSVGALVIIPLNKFNRRFRTSDKTWLIISMIALATCLTLTMSFVWTKTAVLSIDGQEHSLALFILFLLLSLYSCSTDLLYLPHVAVFDSYLMTTYFVGMGLSACVPSVLALIQGVGRQECVPVPNNQSSINTTTTETQKYKAVNLPARFSVQTYFICISAWLLLACAAFIWLSICRRQNQVQQHKATPIIMNNNNHNDGSVEASRSTTPAPDPNKLGTGTFLVLLLITAWCCAWMNAVLPGVQIYACLPYGQLVYHFTLTLSNIANPIACLMPFVLSINRLTWLIVLTMIVTCDCAYILTLAFMSPHPLLQHSWIGATLAVCSNILAIGLLAYLRTVVASRLRQAAGDSKTRLFWCGVSTQLGSMLGAVVMFPAVNVLKLFTMADTCNQ